MNTEEVNIKIIEVSNNLMKDLIDTQIETISNSINRGYQLNIKDIIFIVQAYIINDYTLVYHLDLYNNHSTLYCLILEYLQSFSYELDYIKTCIK